MAHWTPWFELAVAILATWRVAHLIALEDGPFDLIVRLRAKVGHGFIGRLMDCPYCLSLWIAAPFAGLVGNTVAGWIAAWLAISGGASWLELRVSRDHASARIPPGESGA